MSEPIWCFLLTVPDNFGAKNETNPRSILDDQAYNIMVVRDYEVKPNRALDTDIHYQFINELINHSKIPKFFITDIFHT